MFGWTSPWHFPFSTGCGKCQCKRRIRLTSNVKESSRIEDDKESYETKVAKPCCERSYNGVEGTMPLNRLALYKGIIKSRMSCPKTEYGLSRGRNAPYDNTYL